VAFGIAAVVLAIFLIVAVNQISNVVKTGDSHNSVAGTAYVGDWQDVNNPASVIQILPNGSSKLACR
jgi:hypothetical protein